MGGYTHKPSPPSSTPSPISSPPTSSPGGYNNQGRCAAPPHNAPVQPQAANQLSPHPSYPHLGSKPAPAPPRQAMDSPGPPHPQRSPPTGGRVCSQGPSHPPSTPLRGEREQHPHPQPSPANHPATSNGSSVPYCHFQPHPGLGNQGRPAPPPPPPPASSTSVPQLQQHSRAQEAWRHQSRPSSQSLVSIRCLSVNHLT